MTSWTAGSAENATSCRLRTAGWTSAPPCSSQRRSDSAIDPAHSGCRAATATDAWRNSGSSASKSGETRSSVSSPRSI